MNTETLKAEYRALLDRVAPRLQERFADLEGFMLDEATKIAALVGDPNFATAAADARDAVMLRGAANLTNSADLTDQATREVVLTAIRFGAAALAAA